MAEHEAPDDGKKARAYDEEGRRVRAAWAYSRAGREDFAGDVEMPQRTLDRTMAGTRAAPLPELRRIAEISDVPLLFLTHGWALYRGIERIQASEDLPAEAGELLSQILRVARTATTPSSESEDGEDRPGEPEEGAGGDS